MRKWLYNKRNKLNMTQDEAAEQSRISRQFYSFIENGKRTPSVEVAKRIARSLDFDWTKFYEDENK